MPFEPRIACRPELDEDTAKRSIEAHDKALEIFYRWQVLREIAVTPSVQLLIDPALNPDESGIWVFGLRFRYAL